MHRLKVKNLNKSYKDKKVLTNMSLDFMPGESTVIAGESGSGKTTLAKIITGMETQDSGFVIFNNHSLPPLRKRDFCTCAKIQYIFQDPYSALERNYTLLDTLNETMSICRRNKYEYLPIEESLAWVDENMLDYLNKKIDTLSGGQRQKLCIARALITKPEIIIADECTSMLDNESSTEIHELLNKIKIEKNIILISIMHEVDFHSSHWDKIAVIKSGQLVEYKDFKYFYENAENEYSKQLIESYNFFKYESGDKNE